MNNKYICFDIGDVVCDINLEPFFTYMGSTKSSWTKQMSYEICEEMQPRLDLAISTIDSELDRIHLHFKIPKIESSTYRLHMNKLWMSAIKPVKQIEDILKELDNNGVTIALLSNIGIDHAKEIRNLLSIDKYIQHFSCEVGARKPSKLFFQSFEFEHKNFWSGDSRQFRKTREYESYFAPLYLDDRTANLVAARYVFNTQYFSIKNYKNYDDAASALRKILVNNNYLSS